MKQWPLDLKQGGAGMADGMILGEGGLSYDALVGANVNPESGLATDYLNHFNEVVMLLEMLPDMPDCAEDVLAWEPVSYAAHFERTNYSGKEVAIAAYQSAPHALRAHFETIISALDEALENAQDKVRCGYLAAASAMTDTEIEPFLAAARAAVQGRIEGEDIDDCDASQADVDALFG